MPLPVIEINKNKAYHIATFQSWFTVNRSWRNTASIWYIPVHNSNLILDDTVPYQKSNVWTSTNSILCQFCISFHWYSYIHKCLYSVFNY